MLLPIRNSIPTPRRERAFHYLCQPGSIGIRFELQERHALAAYSFVVPDSVQAVPVSLSVSIFVRTLFWSAASVEDLVREIVKVDKPDGGDHKTGAWRRFATSTVPATSRRDCDHVQDEAGFPSHVVIIVEPKHLAYGKDNEMTMGLRKTRR